MHHLSGAMNARNYSIENTWSSELRRNIRETDRRRKKHRSKRYKNGIKQLKNYNAFQATISWSVEFTDSENLLEDFLSKEKLFLSKKGVSSGGLVF